MRTIDTSPAELRALAADVNPCPGVAHIVGFKLQLTIADTLRALAAEKEAAPDLLNALKAALPVVLSAPENTPGLGGRIKAIEAALAKVEGQS